MIPNTYFFNSQTYLCIPHILITGQSSSFKTPVNIYSGISIYQSRNIRFQVFIVHHLWSRIKFHIITLFILASIISPDLSFSPRLSLVNPVPTQHFPHGFCCIVHFRKKSKIEASYVGSVFVSQQRHACQTM
jgi:hypothetical protein